MAGRPRLVVWAEHDQASLIADAVRAAEVELRAVGGPSPAHTTGLVEALGGAAVGDLRQAIQHEDADLLWLATRAGVGADERRLVRDVGVRAFTTEPLPPDVTEARRDPDDAATAAFVPLARWSPGFLSGFDALEQMGPAECLAVTFAGGPGAGSLLARLFDAMDVVITLGGPVESVAAAQAGTGPVPETLGQLRGHMTVNVRLAGRRSATVTVSDTAHAWHRSVTVLGARGSLRFDDVGCTTTDAEGIRLDTGRSETTTPDPGTLVGMQIARTLGGRTTGSAPPDTAALLTLCEAARLSCRTGQVETPQRLREMLRRF